MQEIIPAPHQSALSPVLSAALFSIWLLFLANYPDHQHGSSEVMILCPSGLLVSHYECCACVCLCVAPNGSSLLSVLVRHETLHGNVRCCRSAERLWLIVFPWALGTGWILPSQSATKQDPAYQTKCITLLLLLPAYYVAFKEILVT